MTLREQQSLFVEDVAKLLEHIIAAGFHITFGETYRTAEQAAIYANEGKGIINSLHCKRLAVDLNIYTATGEFLKEAKDYEQFGLFWEKLDTHNRWGGHFQRVDADHFERKEQ